MYVGLTRPWTVYPGGSPSVAGDRILITTSHFLPNAWRRLARKHPESRRSAPSPRSDRPIPLPQRHGLNPPRPASAHSTGITASSETRGTRCSPRCVGACRLTCRRVPRTPPADCLAAPVLRLALASPRYRRRCARRGPRPTRARLRRCPHGLRCARRLCPSSFCARL